MSDQLSQIRVFVRVAALQSFSQAARELGVSQSSVSRLVADLEVRLGVKLLLRTTHQVVATEAGLAYLRRAERLLRDFEAADEAARGVDSLTGVLRIATPMSFGTQVVVPILGTLLADHPELRVELLPYDEAQDLVAKGVDLAVRFGRLADSEFGARRLGTMQRIVVAAPSYLARRGTPEEPNALAGHECIFGPGMTSRPSWLFSGEPVPSGLIERVRIASAEGVVACAVAGHGVAVSTLALAGRELETGRLVRILTDYALPSVDLHAVYPAGSRPSRKVRVFVDLLAGAIEGLPGFS